MREPPAYRPLGSDGPDGGRACRIYTDSPIGQVNACNPGDWMQQAATRKHPPNEGASIIKSLIGFQNYGAPGRVRTRDPLITNQVLYQLSYKGNACQVPDSAVL